jgi:hypothetical protein
VIRHDAKWLEQNMTVKVTEFLQVTRKLKGYRVQFVEKRTAALHRDAKRDATLFVTARYDLYEVSRAIMSVLLKRPRQQDLLALETILESDLRRLKTKGYNVDRILRQKAAESRIAASERQKREEEQRRLAESQAASSGPPTLPMPSSNEKGNPPPQHGGSNALTRSTKPTTPEKSLSMPGAFGDSPEPSDSLLKGKQPGGLFSSLTRQFGLNNLAGQAGQQMQKMLNSGQRPDMPPPYAEHDPSGSRALTPGTERVTSPRDLQSNLQSAINATREYNASSLFSPPSTKEIKETPSYCDSKPGHDINLIAELGNGIKLYLSRDHANPDSFLSTNREGIAHFVTILTETAAIFDLSPQTVNIFHDAQGASIAFNSNGSLFCNLRYFLQLHMGQIDSAEGRVEALAYWFVTLCHELAHNLVSIHDQRHSYYTESFVSHYFRRMLWLATRVTVGMASSAATTPAITSAFGQT